jgi:glycosyltransferase involved in cell wall biosynthesis
MAGPMAASEHDDITAVVTCFNYGEFLEEAVQSLLDQEGGPPRVVVVDDGSTDPATLAVLDGLPSGVELIRQANQGLSAARNTGMRGAQTPYLIALDADDRLPPGALRALRGPLDADRGLGFTYGTTRFFGDWEGDMPMPPYDPYRLLYRHTIGPTCLTRRELFDDVGGYDPDFRGYEDWEFWLAALERGWLGRQIPDVTFLYRRHGATMLSGARRQYRHWYRLLRRKHAPLFRQRASFAKESDLGLAGRMVYRFYWGPRPLPARVEHQLYRVLFGA